MSKVISQVLSLNLCQKRNKSDKAMLQVLKKTKVHVTPCLEVGCFKSLARRSTGEQSCVDLQTGGF